MPQLDPRVEYCTRRHKMMDALRAPFLTDWYDIRQFVRPITVTFNPVVGAYQLVRTENIFDGTAINALEQLASALHSYLTNPAERWFEIIAEGIPAEQLDDASLEWLEMVSEIIYAAYSRPSVNFNLAMTEGYLDVGSFGTACVNQEWDMDTNDLVFNARPIGQCYFFEDSKGHVDTVHINYHWTLRNIKQEFGAVLPPELMKEQNDDKVFEVIHCVYPREDRNPRMATPTNKKYASVWISLTTKEILSESGYDALPYHVPRWTKLAGEVYGRSPAKKCLADIKMLNKMEQTILKAGQKVVDPPLVLTNDGWLAPIRTAPGALIFKEDEQSKIEPLITQANLPWAEEKAKQKRDFISECFYADWIRMEKENVEMTAYEVQDRRDEKLRLLAPMLGRLITEWHGPMIARSYHLKNDHGQIPLAPISLRGKRLSIGYLGPASRAQLGVKANAISRVMNDLLPLTQVNPGITDVIDFDQAAVEFALARGVPRSVIRSPDAIAQLRQQRQQQQSAQQVAQTAVPASQAIKNIADAQRS